MLAAMNAMNGGMMGGMGGLGGMGGMGGMGGLGGMGGMMANGGVNPGMMAGGLNPPMVAGGGAGFIGQPQFAQFVPGVSAYAAPAPIPQVYAVPAVGGFPYMGAPQVAQMAPQQPLMGITGGAVQQQPPLQPDPLRRFRRQIMKQDNPLKTTVDTQIPAPTGTTTTTPPCDDHHDDY
uniref:secretory calcium-binding phosphoprotein 9 n=1 Tax=Epinephelus lanceolatus TaxID=310571 RepID=UPI001447DD94|nr:secretory calcium-binding phosphoprotein 9 [Epinephelus lanceolatus]